MRVQIERQVVAVIHRLGPGVCSAELHVTGEAAVQLHLEPVVVGIAIPEGIVNGVITLDTPEEGIRQGYKGRRGGVRVTRSRISTRCQKTLSVWQRVQVPC